MQSTTLRGVFPEPKPICRRNFIKENVKSIKHMQGILQEAGVIQPRQFKPVRKPIISAPYATSTSKDNISKDTKANASLEKFKNKVTRTKVAKLPSQKTLAVKKKEPTEDTTRDLKTSNRSVQTEKTDDIMQLYQTGVIKYASSGSVKHDKNVKNKSDPSLTEQLGAGDAVCEEMQKLDLEDRDFVRENKTVSKPRLQKPVTSKVPARPPSNYRRGVLPRYLQERKEMEGPTVEEDHECPPGHILLPEEERKETLRVLRQSYADRIQELNMMPLRNDTLKMRKRKMDIEEELKKIEGGIKVFQRPKVYVKINA